MYPIIIDYDNDEILIPNETIQAISLSKDFMILLSKQCNELVIRPGTIAMPEIEGKVGRKGNPLSMRKSWNENKQCYYIDQIRLLLRPFLEYEMYGRYEVHGKLNNGLLFYDIPQAFDIVDTSDYKVVSPKEFHNCMIER